MKPDGVATAALEPMETLESNPVNEEAPPTEQEPNQATAPEEQETPQTPAAQTKGHLDSQPNQAKESSAAKTSSKNSAEPKAKAIGKGTAKTKPGSTSSSKLLSGQRTSTPQNRIANGVTKPQMNGAAKKTAPAVEKKNTPTSASSKKPAGAGAPVPKTPAKVGEKKAAGLSVSSNSSKTASGAAAVKKPSPATADGVKSNTSAAAAKKPPAPKSANSTPSKLSAAASTKPDKPLVSKTTRATTSTPNRPATGSSQSATTPKTPMVSSKPATPKTPSSSGKPATFKSASSTPSGGKPPVSQASRNTTPLKKDVTKPSTPAAKKPADSPLTRPSSVSKSSKPETPKSSSKLDVAAKKSNANKISESKTPNRTKTQESKATPTKNSSTKPAASKTTSPKKTVGSSTPTPVKRAPKPAAADGAGKEVAAAGAAAAAIATAAAVIAEPEQGAHVEVSAAAQEETPEAALEPVPESQSTYERKPNLLQEPAAEPTQEPTPEPVKEPTPEPVREPTPEPIKVPTPEPVREPTPEPMKVPTPEPVREPTPEPMKVPTPEPVREPTPEPVREPTPEPINVPTPEPIKVPTPEPLRVPTPEPLREPTPEPVREPTPEPVREPTPEPIKVPTPEPVREPTPEPIKVPTPEPVREPTPEPINVPTPEPIKVPTPEPVREPTPEPVREPTPEPVRVPTPESVKVPTPEPLRVPTPEPVREPTPEPVREPTPEPVREPTPEPVRVPTPESVKVPTPEPVRIPTPEPMRIPTPEPMRESTPEPARELTPEFVEDSTPELLQKPTSDDSREPTPEPTHEETEHEPRSYQIQEPSSEILVEPPQSSAAAELGSGAAHMDPFHFQEPTSNSFPSLGTTVMSPPCSPPGPASPVRQPQSASPLLHVDVQSDSWALNQEDDEEQEGPEMQGKKEDEEQKKENLFLPPLSAPGAFDAAAQLHFLGASPPGVFIPGDLISPGEKEEAVEKADEEINEDVEDDDDEDDEDEQRRLGQQLSSMITDMSSSQPSDEFQVRSSVFGGSAGWHGDDLLSGMDSEDVSSCTSSRQPGVSDLSSTQHTAILEGTQSSDALVDSSLRGSEGDGNLMGSPNVETIANEEDEDEEDERVDDMDMSSERLEEQHALFKKQEQNEEEDEDVEMHSEGLVESSENVDEDGFHEEEQSDNLNFSTLPPCAPPISTWSQNNPFSDTWTQPVSLLSVSSPSPVSDHGAAESETPTQSPAQACLDSGAPSFAPQTEHEPGSHSPERSPLMGLVPEETPDLLAPPAVGVSQSSPLSGAALAAHSSSETSTPEELRDYDSSSGVESRSDKQQTPVPASVQPDMDQDLGIHMEKGDGEEEEAETLPADEVPGTGPPTAPASDPSSPSTSGDEASDTEGEMQINDPENPMKMDDGVEFESPSPTCGLPALEEEAGNTAMGEGEEDGGGATPQSANSVASYGFDCTTSNSNAHSMAESCGKSPGIFSLENEEQLPEEAKDPSLIKELTLPSAAAAQSEDLLGSAVDLMPLSHTEEHYPSLDDRHYLLGGKLAAEHLEDPQEQGQHTRNPEAEDTGDFQPPYYSTICDKTDGFLEGDEKSTDEEEDHTWQSDSQEDNWNQNQTSFPIANCHYLALVPGNRRPIDPALAEHFAEIAPPPPLKGSTGEQLRRMEQHQKQVREVQEQEKQKREWLEEERLRLEQQRLLEKQRRELLQLQLQQQQHEHRHRRQVLQWQLELEHQYRMQQKQIQQQQQLRRSPTGVMLSPSSGLCTIYESMETSDEEDEAGQEQNKNLWLSGSRVPSPQYIQQQPRPVPPQELEWNKKVDMVQQLINQTLILSGDGGCPPLLLLPVGTGGTLSPLESSMWPSLPPQFSPPAATVTSVSSYSPDSRSSSPSGDWTVVELETQH